MDKQRKSHTNWRNVGERECTPINTKLDLQNHITTKGMAVKFS